MGYITDLTFGLILGSGIYLYIRRDQVYDNIKSITLSFVPFFETKTKENNNVDN
jgi:prepilin signal peptidase PulO-like enzyme (type II secretory pathway)